MSWDQVDWKRVFKEKKKDLLLYKKNAFPGFIAHLINHEILFLDLDESFPELETYIDCWSIMYIYHNYKLSSKQQDFVVTEIVTPGWNQILPWSKIKLGDDPVRPGVVTLEEYIRLTVAMIKNYKSASDVDIFIQDGDTLVASIYIPH